jgi:hypothetical protein
MTSPEDLEHLVRWRYENFMASKSVSNRDRTAEEFDDHKDCLPTARTVGLYLDGRLVASMRMHALNAENFNIEALDVERDRVEREVARGRRFVVASRWITDPAFSNLMPLTVAATRITCLAAGYHDADYLLSTSRESHARMYARMQDAKIWSEKAVAVPHYNYLYHLIASDFHAFRERMHLDRQAYLSSARERSEMFAPDADHRRMIVPSAAAVLSGEETSGF